MRWTRILGLAVGGGVGGLYLTTNQFENLNYQGFLRFGRAVATVFSIGYHYKTNLTSLHLDRSSPEYRELRSQAHTAAAEKFLDLCSINKGVYVKIGQHIATLTYIVPHEYVNVLKKLQNDAPKSDVQSLLKILKEDLGKDPYEIFACFEEEPIGTASLAQVHKAKLKDGTVVAVKIQHPTVLKEAEQDMTTMEILAKLAKRVFKGFDFDWLVTQQRKSLTEELNFKLEAANAEKVQEQLKNFKWLKIPKIYWDLTSERVLTMEYVPGCKITDLNYIDKTGINRFDVMSKLGEMYSHMIFEHGFVHSDPHPGNIFVRKCRDEETSMVLLDHGLYAELTEEFRLDYSRFWLSILEKDFDKMKLYSQKFGVKEDLYPVLVCMVTGRTWNAVNKGIERVKYSSKEGEKIVETAPEVVDKIGEVLAKVDRQMLLILKANDTLRGIEFALHVEERQPSFLITTKCCIDNIFKENLKKCQSSMSRFRLRMSRNWAICKLNIYYFYLNLKSIVFM